MTSLHCIHRDHAIHTDVVEHPGIPTPWSGGCHITMPDGRITRRLSISVDYRFFSELDKAQRASIAHGKWLVDQHLDKGVAMA